MKKPRFHVAFFVEGATEKEFYDFAIRYKLQKIKTKSSYQVVNLTTIGRFETKIPAKLKNEIIPKKQNTRIKVVCCYDSDVFEFSQNPPVNWKIVKQKVKELGIVDFEQIEAVHTIEDWFLKDIPGLCKYLKINEPKKLEGKTGYDKMKLLFKKGNKIYQKGSHVHKFIDFLDIDKISGKIQNELSVIDKVFENSR